MHVQHRFLPELGAWVTVYSRWRQPKRARCCVCRDAATQYLPLMRCSARLWGWRCCRKRVCLAHAGMLGFGLARCPQHAATETE